MLCVSEIMYKRKGVDGCDQTVISCTYFMKMRMEHICYIKNTVTRTVMRTRIPGCNCEYQDVLCEYEIDIRNPIENPEHGHWEPYMKVGMRISIQV